MKQNEYSDRDEDKDEEADGNDNSNANRRIQNTELRFYE